MNGPSAPPVGGGFLLERAGSRPIFTPEQLTEEQRLFSRTAQEFMERTVLPQNARIEAMEPGLMRSLLRQAGELGFLAADIPEAYGGLGLDKTTSALLSAEVSVQGSFGVAFGAQVGIGSLPIVIFGTESQKRRYLPALATGEKVAAYCLSEPGSGSDALGARTTAVLDGDAYVLNGTKAWISNAGFADVYIVFAQVDGSRFTGFIVDRDTPGLSLGAEEHKLGIKGSSTRQVILDNARVPVDNVLGEIGRGHVIAFNILNIGRYKLGLGVNGSAKRALRLSLAYAAERHQFKTRILDFPAIREKVARMAGFIFANESMGWRFVGQLDERLATLDKSDPEHWRHAAKALEEYAVECSILKVFGTEGVGACHDEAIQIHGGNGFTTEYPVEQAWRDSRVNRIFEGTNEINRMLIPGTLLKRAMQGRLDLMSLAQEVQARVTRGERAPVPADDAPLALETFFADQAKQVVALTMGAAALKFAFNLQEQQEVLLGLADMVIDTFAADSTVARVQQIVAQVGAEAAADRLALARVICTEAARRVAARGRDLAGHLGGDAATAAGLAGAIDRLLPFVPLDLVSARRRIAASLVEAGRYCF
jgi:alkylation response protein AidB-like acyl-CoA dehydrogenase